MALQARKQFPMLAEFAARMNCGGAEVASTSSFMRNMMHSQTLGSYDNVIATQTFGDEEEEEEVCLQIMKRKFGISRGHSHSHTPGAISRKSFVTGCSLVQTGITHRLWGILCFLVSFRRATRLTLCN